MKSKRAQKELEKLEKFYPFSGWIAPSDTYRIAEIAEQEAEERMREKAIEVHRKVCFFRNFKDNTCANTATKCGEHSCYYMNYLIQKLNEDEND